MIFLTDTDLMFKFPRFYDWVLLNDRFPIGSAVGRESGGQGVYNARYELKGIKFEEETYTAFALRWGGKHNA